MPEDRKVVYATFLLQGAANNWWDAQEKHLTPPITWVMFRDLFYKEFLPPSVLLQLQTDFLELV